MEISPLQPTPVGAFRFNTDTLKLEYYDGNQWVNITSDSTEQQTGGTRGLMLGGYERPEGGVVNTIQYINMATTGNALDFGDLQAIGYGNGSFSNRTTGIYLDNNPNNQRINLSSTGNSVSTGGSQNSGEVGRNAGANSIRGLFQWDVTPQVNTIEYFNIASSSRGIDFGDAATVTNNKGTMGASPTRWVVGGGTNSNWSAVYNLIEYVNFMTQGNSSDFGDLTVARTGARGTGGNAVRGVYAGGYLADGNAPGPYGVANTIDYITVATLGNALDFGDLTVGSDDPAIMTSSTRAVFAGGTSGVPSPANGLGDIDYVKIVSTGNAVDFGDFIDSMEPIGAMGCSNGHGGLG